jgi:hypothetical protein
LDYYGAALATSGFILLTFVLSSGGVYGWGKVGALCANGGYARLTPNPTAQAFIIVLLIIGVALIIAFAFAETKVENPLVPSHL